MRIAELSRRTGVPVPTIKYYLREGMLPPGERVGRNQALYSDGHVHRLKLVRTMVEIGGLSIAAVRTIVGALDEPSDLDEQMGMVSQSLTPAPDPDTVDPEAMEWALRLLDLLGWTDCNKHPALRTIANVYAAARDLGQERLTDGFVEYARACERIAAVDLDYIEKQRDVQDALEGVIAGTLLGDTAMVALRRIAQAMESHKRYGEET